MLSGKSFYRHYWKSELIEWINHLKDCERDRAHLITLTIKGYDRNSRSTGISYGILDFGIL
jgi:hypothetical protein